MVMMWSKLSDVTSNHWDSNVTRIPNLIVVEDSL